jgi:hypothetical protein
MEFIGLAIGTLTFLGLAAMVGALTAAVAWFVVRKRQYQRIPLAVIAGTLPIISAAYLWLCVAILPGESLFGDISQPLPNGYSVQALGKMSDFATINKGNNVSDGAMMHSEYIGKLAVSGLLVAGQYSHPFGTFEPHPNEGFFIFDTQTGKFTDLKTLDDLEKSLGHPVELASTSLFRSTETTYKRQQAINRVIMFGPPLLSIVGYFILLFRFRKRASLS